MSITGYRHFTCLAHSYVVYLPFPLYINILLYTGTTYSSKHTKHTNTIRASNRVHSLEYAILSNIKTLSVEYRLDFNLKYSVCLLNPTQNKLPLIVYLTTMKYCVVIWSNEQTLYDIYYSITQSIITYSLVI